MGNPYHKPRGSPEGGEFTSGPGTHAKYAKHAVKLQADFKDYYGGDNYGTIVAKDKSGKIVGALDFSGNKKSNPEI